MTTNVILDLHCDSLSLAEIKAEIQNRFSVTANPPLSSLKTIGDLCILAV
jgi:acyl carrier protein